MIKLKDLIVEDKNMFPKEFNRHLKGGCGFAIKHATEFLLRKGIKNFKIVEGSILMPNDKQLYPHIWIEFDGGRIFDPSKKQFQWKGDINKICYVKDCGEDGECGDGIGFVEYTPEEYLRL